VAKVVVSSYQGIDSLKATVTQGPVGPDSLFTGGTEGTCWVSIECKGQVARYRGTYTAGFYDIVVETKRERIHRQIEELKTKYRKQYQKRGFVGVDLDELARRLA